MSGKSRKASTHITLENDVLHGYNGSFDIIRRRRRPWWRRLLRRPHQFERTMVYGNVRGGSARVWKRGGEA